MIASSSLTCRDYRDLFLRRRDEIWTGPGEIPSPAMVTWILCLERAESLLPVPAVRLVLVFLALLDGHGVPGAVFGTRALTGYLAADQGQIWDVLLALERAGLIGLNRDVTPPTVLMSSALQEAIKLAPADFTEPAARAAASALLEAWPVEELSPWAAASLRSNAASLQDSAMDALWVDGCHPLLRRVGLSLDEARLAGPAVEFWQDLAARCDAKLPPGHPDALAVADHLAAAYLADGRLKDAIAQYKRVLADREKVLGRDHLDTIATADNLAAVYRTAGRMPAAIQLAERSRADSERVLGNDHADTLARMVNLAHAYYAVGRLGDAVLLLHETAIRCDRVLASDDPLTETVRQSLANIGEA